MKKLIFVAALVLLTGPAFGQSVAEKTGVNKALGIAPRTQDFVKEVAISDMFEIESSKLAQDKGDQAAKDFAGHMVDDHTKTSTELKGMVSDGKVKASIPTALDSSHQKKLDKLKSLSGADFTKQYDSVQVSAHKDAVNLFTRYSKGGKNADLKSWAGQTLPKLQEHLQMAQALKK
jgi:putative membrane protein